MTIVPTSLLNTAWLEKAVGSNPGIVPSGTYMVVINSKQQETDTVTPHELSSLSHLWNLFENCQRK